MVVWLVGAVALLRRHLRIVHSMMLAFYASNTLQNTAFLNITETLCLLRWLQCHRVARVEANDEILCRL